MKWLRLYHDILNDPKVMMLSETNRWHYVALLCIASGNDPRGTLPDENEISFRLRITAKKVQEIIDNLTKANLIKNNKINGWDKRQFQSDNVTTRVQKTRMKQLGNVTVTTSDTDTDKIQKDTDNTGDSEPKVKHEAKRKKKKFIPPILDDVISYFTDNGYSEAGATQAFKYYDEADPPWTDSTGKKVRGWKQKFRGNWFRDEFLVKEKERDNNIQIWCVNPDCVQFHKPYLVTKRKDPYQCGSCQQELEGM